MTITLATGLRVEATYKNGKVTVKLKPKQKEATCSKRSQRR